MVGGCGAPCGPSCPTRASGKRGRTSRFPRRSTVRAARPCGLVVNRSAAVRIEALCRRRPRSARRACAARRRTTASAPTWVGADTSLTWLHRSRPVHRPPGGRTSSTHSTASRSPTRIGGSRTATPTRRPTGSGSRTNTPDRRSMPVPTGTAGTSASPRSWACPPHCRAWPAATASSSSSGRRAPTSSPSSRAPRSIPRNRRGCCSTRQHAPRMRRSRSTGTSRTPTGRSSRSA
ncbi:unannotated protein [freshwater metagenome]|uniref:Unannotated protein n=1 Tax=freshwater metagenome TaxID=449393 RepID=A0A6J6DRF4_9ZZZZ